MNCQTARECMHERFDSLLSNNDARRLENHLQSCPSCRVLYDQLAEVQRGLDVLRSVSKLEDCRDGAIVRPATPRHVRRWSRLAAALALAAGIGLVARMMLDERTNRTHAPPPPDVTPVVAYPPIVRLGASSSTQYMPVMQETDRPDVHIVWLYHALPARSDDRASPAGDGAHRPRATDTVAAVMNCCDKPVT